jgi:hypothetical protein
MKQTYMHLWYPLFKFNKIDVAIIVMILWVIQRKDIMDIA